MLDLRSREILGTVTLVAVAAVTLVVAPYTLLDPMNLPKLPVLAFFAVIALSLIAPSVIGLFRSSYKSLAILLSLFIIQILLVFFFSGANLSGQFYGTFGRNTGALTYISFAILSLSASLVADKEFLKRFMRTALIIGALLVVYGNAQYLGLEPFPYVNGYTVNAPVGTFGNSNFQSAFMGMIAVLSFTMALNSGYKPLARFGLAAMGFASLVVVYETLAKQGYLNFVAGAGIVAILWLLMNKRKSLAIAVGGIGIVGGVLVFLGLINAGPLADLIYKSSLAARGYYWRAGIKMLTDHPFFGVGMDGFGTWYMRSRPED
jgi:O-antigen ligase